MSTNTVTCYYGNFVINQDFSAILSEFFIIIQVLINV